MQPPQLPGGAASAVVLPILAATLGVVGAASAPWEARAQGGPIVFDGTIGPVMLGDEPLLDGTTYLILDGQGAFSGNNLFFSFLRFGVPEPNDAFFLDLSGQPTQAVIARVTGGEPSEIFGGIDTGQFVPGADFFLLNAGGIYLGPNSSLNVGGSVYLATAERLRWGPDAADFFDTTGADPDPVMRATDPVSFGFLAENPAPVGIYGAVLKPSARNTLGLAGGIVEVVGAELTEESGLVEIAAVQGNPGELMLPLDFADLEVGGRTLGPVRLGFSELRGDPALPPAVATLLAALPDSPSTIDVSPTGLLDPGSVVIRAGQFVMRGGQVLDVAAPASPVPPTDYAIDVEVSEGLSLEAGASLLVENVSGSATGGAIRLVGDTISVLGDAQVVSQNTGGAAGGAILVSAVQQVWVTDGGQIFSQAVGAASAPGGNVSVRASAPDGRILVQGTSAPGPMPQVSQISAVTETSDAGGDGGTLLVEAALIEVRDGGQLRTSTLGEGAAGALGLTAGALVISGTADVAGEVVGAGLFALTKGNGRGGELSVTADTLLVENGARVSTSSQASGTAGNLGLLARRVTVRGGPEGPAIVAAEAQADGDAGNLVVRADQLELVDGGALTALTTSTGNAGDVDVAARRVLISGTDTGMFAQNSGGGFAGDAGSVLIDVSEELRVERGGAIAVSSVEFGIAGDVRISGGGDVELSDGAGINATLEGSIRGPAFPGEDLSADVRIEGVRSLRLSKAAIKAETFGDGQGGDIVIETSGEIVLDNGSSITAQSTSTNPNVAGDAGRIEIEAGSVLAVLRGSRLETSAQGASGGIISLDAGELVYLSDARVATDVAQPPAGEAAGDVVLSLPTLAVLNRSAIVARARGEGNAGNILIATRGGFFPSDPLLDSIDAASPGASILDATAGPAGIAGSIEIVSPTADLVSQVTPLPVEFFDASKLLTTPCEARRARRGSLTVQSRAALQPPPDALFGTVLPAGPAGVPEPDAAPTGDCPTT